MIFISALCLVQAKQPDPGPPERVVSGQWIPERIITGLNPIPAESLQA